MTIVWIAERVTDEHRAALDWLNQVTNPSINFFALEIELWQIGSSAPAPKFNIVSQPNDWTKRTTATHTLSEFDLLKLELWTQFRDFLQASGSPMRSQKPTFNHWTNYAIGRSGFNLTALVGMRDGYIGINLYIGHALADSYFRLLMMDREAIDTALGVSPEWRDTGGKSRIVELYRRDVNPTDRDQWPEYFGWLKQHLEAFHRVFSPRIQQLERNSSTLP